MRIGLGIDTGGTYTDAVIMDLDTNEVLCKAKSPTTREDLCIGIRGAVQAMDPELLGKVGIVSMSSTLATNSIVEGKGARVALLCIGGEYDGSYPADISTEIAGSHDLHGAELVPLDENAAREFLESVRGKADGVAITGYLSVRNPAHENRVRELVDEILGLPSVCGHDLSSGLGFNERTATCVMNTRLIPVIEELMDSVKAVLSENGIRAPLMVIRGDGSMMSEEEARRKPVETVVSGPAASMIGAMRMTGVRDAVVMDMGGTTTDIGILRNGKPRLESEGAIIGGARTRVMAAKVSTSGIGGDSRILIIGSDAVLSPLRVMPICRAAETWPSVKEAVLKLRETSPRLYAMQDEDSIVLESEFFRTLRIPEEGNGFSQSEINLLKLLQGEPKALHKVAEELGVHPFTLGIKRLERLGLVQRIGFTPTDVLHALGEYDEFDSEASLCAAGYLAKGIRMDRDGFLARCRELIRIKLCTELMYELMDEETGSSKLGPAGEDLLKKAISGTGNDYLCSIRLTKPIIGIGAPVSAYIPRVGEAFGTEVLIQSDSDVGNAIGAISSSVSESVTVLVRPKSLGKDDCFHAFSRLGRFEYGTFEEALADSEDRARKEVLAKAAENGAEDISVVVERRDREFEYGDSGAKCLMEIELTVTAAGRPRPFSD